MPQCIPMNATELGVVSSMFTLGGFIGAMAGGPAGNKYGRLRTMMGTIFFFVLGPVFEALAPNIGVLALGRLISGFGAGASVVVVPIYISEISPPEEKGFFGSLTQVMVNGGIFTTQLLGYFTCGFEVGLQRIVFLLFLSLFLFRFQLFLVRFKAFL